MQLRMCNIFYKLNHFCLQFSINRDKKGYNKGDGALIVGAFFRKNARESALAKLSLGTFPTIPIAPQNVNRVAADLFVRAARQHFHHEILKCFDAFNRGGGRTVQLQNGQRMRFSKSIILAIYADYPAARNCTVTTMLHATARYGITSSTIWVFFMHTKKHSCD
jgi:hypothetical protein